MEFEQLRQAIVNHQNERTIFSSEYPTDVADRLIEEANELKISLLEAEIGGGVTEVANELADCFIILLDMADSLGIDILQATQMKQMRNEYKCPKTALNNGYPEPYKTTSEAYKMMGGDEVFYQVYLLLLADE